MPALFSLPGVVGSGLPCQAVVQSHLLPFLPAASCGQLDKRTLRAGNATHDRRCTDRTEGQRPVRPGGILTDPRPNGILGTEEPTPKSDKSLVGGALNAWTGRPPTESNLSHVPGTTEASRRGDGQTSSPGERFRTRKGMGCRGSTFPFYSCRQSRFGPAGDVTHTPGRGPVSTSEEGLRPVDRAPQREK